MGDTIERLLKSNNPRLPFVSCRAELEAALLGNDEAGPTNWGLASDTFPKVVKILDLPPYHVATISGLVLSVGGLTEAVVKSSSTALMGWCREKKKSIDGQELSNFSKTLFLLFHEHRGDDRVTLPVMKTMDMLLSKGIFEAFATEEPPTFGLSLLEHVKNEILKSTNIIKLFTGIPWSSVPPSPQACCRAILHETHCRREYYRFKGLRNHDGGARCDCVGCGIGVCAPRKE